ncbi:MAG: histidine kinase [Thermomicrobiales bacterium]
MAPEANKAYRNDAPVAIEAKKEAARELAALTGIADALGSSIDLPQALARTLALVADLLGLQTGWIWLLDPESQQFYLAAAQNLPPYLQEPVRMSGRWCQCTDSFRRGELMPTNIDVLECTRLRPAVLAHASDETLGLRYHASVPLTFQERKLGIINVAGPSWRELTDEELGLLSAIAYQAGLAVERARLAEESRRLARAEERGRIAREIHDTLAQGLTAIALDVEGALRHLDDHPERSRQRLDRALAAARENLEAARRSVLDLRAAPLADRPLAGALAALARGFTSETGVQAPVRVEGETVLPPHVEAELFRIAQEALVNVRKHSQATGVEIALRATPRHVVMIILDNGVGFEVRRPTSGHYGILGMRERAKLLGGRLRVESRPGRGTRITARVPLAEAAS